MPAEVNDRYLRYIVARLAAYRNVWWSLANEYDLVKTKTLADWDRFFRIVQESDPYQHLRSIHHGTVMYDHSKPWVTHVSLQSSDLEKAREYVAAVPQARDLRRVQVRRQHPQALGQHLRAGNGAPLLGRHGFGGAYVGHGETYLDPARHPVVVEGRRAARPESASASRSCARSSNRRPPRA